MRSYKGLSSSVAGTGVLVALLWAPHVAGQVFRSAVGGIEIDADGVLNLPTAELSQRRSAEIRAEAQPVPGDLQDVAPLRTVSLRALNEQLTAVDSTRELPDEVRYLAGLTRIQYLVVDAENRDLLLVGPAEPWTFDAQGTCVGTVSGRAILLLDDLLVAFRNVESARQIGMSCSIDPTTEGRQALAKYFARQRQYHPRMSREIEQVMGSQEITLSGVPEDSHLACVLVAADYQMKRYAMQLDPPPVAGLASFLQLTTSRFRNSNVMPRWWLACDYQPIAKSDDGLIWQLRGQGVKAMTEDEYISASGEVTSAGVANPAAQKWADNMTARYDELSIADPIFGQLRNIMDLSVIAALIEREDLFTLAECPAPRITTGSEGPATEQWHAPKRVATVSSVVKRGRDFIVTASGGVQIDSWYAAAQVETDARLGPVAKQVAAKRSGWRW